MMKRTWTTVATDLAAAYFGYAFWFHQGLRVLLALTTILFAVTPRVFPTLALCFIWLLTVWLGWTGSLVRDRHVIILMHAGAVPSTWDARHTFTVASAMALLSVKLTAFATLFGWFATGEVAEQSPAIFVFLLALLEVVVDMGMVEVPRLLVIGREQEHNVVRRILGLPPQMVNVAPSQEQVSWIGGRRHFVVAKQLEQTIVLDDGDGGDTLA